MMDGCDTLLMVGTSFPYSEWLPKPGQARAVQIDIDGRLVGMRYPTEVNLVGRRGRDAARAGAAAARARRTAAGARRSRPTSSAGGRSSTTARSESANPINPQLVFHELSPRLPDGAILTADSGSATNWWARHLSMRAGMDAALSGTLATMCPADPVRAGGQVRATRTAR